MRKIIALLLFSICILTLPIEAYADVHEKSSVVVEYFEDGSYLEEVLLESFTRASGIKTASKSKNYRNSDGILAWSITVTGTFTYDGTSAKCTAADCNVSITDSAWYTVSKSTSKNGATASASVVMGEMVSGVTIEQISTNITITCNANGNVS